MTDSPQSSNDLLTTLGNCLAIASQSGGMKEQGTTGMRASLAQKNASWSTAFRRRHQQGVCTIPRVTYLGLSNGRCGVEGVGPQDLK